MRRAGTSIRVALAGLACLAATLAPTPPVVADDTGGGCGGKWTKTTKCHLNLRGFPITIFADAFGSNAAVKAWVQIQGRDEFRIVECQAKGSGYAKCEDALDPAGETIDERWVAVIMSCHVEGTSWPAGYFYCQSALGF